MSVGFLYPQWLGAKRRLVQAPMEAPRHRTELGVRYPHENLDYSRN